MPINQAMCRASNMAPPRARRTAHAARLCMHLADTLPPPCRRPAAALRCRRSVGAELALEDVAEGGEVAGVVGLRVDDRKDHLGMHMCMGMGMGMGMGMCMCMGMSMGMCMCMLAPAHRRAPAAAQPGVRSRPEPANPNPHLRGTPRARPHP